MKTITRKDRERRGCVYCEDVVRKRVGQYNSFFCPYEVCPYSELTKYDSYKEYIKANIRCPNIMQHFAALDRKENLEDDESFQ